MRTSFLVTLLIWTCAPCAAQSICTPSWSPDFYFASPAGPAYSVFATTVFDGPNGPAVYFGGTAGGAGRVSQWDGQWATVADFSGGWVNALAAFDDGTGMALYVGGTFTSAAGIPALRIARWNGVNWSQVGAGFNGAVNALYVFDGGTGPALYAGGAFSSSGVTNVAAIAQWNGSTWQTVAGGVGNAVHSIGSFDIGNGPRLVISGVFQTPTLRIAQLVNNSWQSMGPGLSAHAHAYATFDDGSGPALYIGGEFSTIGGVNMPGVARWNGTNWSPVGFGLNHWVYSLAVFDSPSGPALYAGGMFNASGPNTALKVARWDGRNWLPLDAGVTGNGAGDHVRCLLATSMPFDDGARLYVSGSISEVNQGSVQGVARWDGENWTNCQPGHGVNLDIGRLYEFDLGSGPSLYATAGYNSSTIPFSAAGQISSRIIARWDGTRWWPLRKGLNSGTIRDAIMFDDGNGPALYVAGSFPSIDGHAMNNIARWDGEDWSSVGNGTNGQIRTLAIYDDGNGPAIYAGGDFTIAGTVAANRIARWNGNNWSRLGGLGNGVSGGNVNALAVFGKKLYAAGTFTAAGGDPTIARIASWDGQHWQALGMGSTVGISSLFVLDDPLGPALFARSISGSNLKRWNGSEWTLDVSTSAGGTIESLIVHEDSSGPALYVGGGFFSIAGIVARCVAKWDGANWSALGSGPDCIIPNCNAVVRSMAILDDGSPEGPCLHVAGFFQQVAGTPANNVAKWAGSQWQLLDGGVPNGAVYSLRAFRGNGPMAIYAAGWFSNEPPHPNHFTRWEICDPEAPPGDFSPLAPRNEGLETTLQPLFHWTQAPGLFVRYYLIVADDPELKNLVYESPELLGFEHPLPEQILEHNQEYYWSVRAQNPVGEQWLDVQTFRTLGNPDITGDGVVNVMDLLAIVQAWGACPPSLGCDADLNADFVVNVEDLLLVLQFWNP